MVHRHWTEVISETRQKIVSPLPKGVIQNKLGLNHQSLQKLIDQGILVFVDNQRRSWKGPLPQRYIAVKDGIK